MSLTFGALLAERRAPVVGRERERAALAALLEPDGPLVAIVHGIAGSGKSALLRAFAADAAASGARVATIDARAIEPTPQGFRAAAAPDADVLLIDTAERLRLLEDWLRGSFLPALPATVRVVIATRDAPGAAWRAPFGDLLLTVPVGGLEPDAAAALLRTAGVEEAQAAAVGDRLHGHPLSLQLAAAALREQEATPDAVLPTVLHELAALYLDGLDPATRAALEAAATLRRVTLSLLAALLGDRQAADAFERLRALPFADVGREGLVIHDAVREAVAALLRATDPVRERAQRAAAWRQIRSELRASHWGAVADMIHLVEEPLVREAFFPSRAQHYAIETAGAEDGDAILAIAARHEPAEHVALLREWWERLPGAFRVARRPRGDVVAFVILCELTDVPRRLLDDDPLCAPWRQHLRAYPPPPGEHVLLARHALAWATGAAPSPCFAALLRDIERATLETGPALHRIYTYASGDPLLAQLAPLGYLPLPDGADVGLGGVAYRPLLCDLGPEGLAGWLSGLAARDLPVASTRLDEDARELLLDGRRIALTKLEWDVMRYLRERNGRAVAREALLRDVWGYKWTGGSNVVEVAVSGLRRKLGNRAGALETVRGVGYRLRLG
ncbi:MAG TPA: winged helix-turn-helix domain-containing protein [Solirubrobacter sp.]|nr:winged helix-turn-helix domain-containing protein [Solirubrobacter sp.]